MYKLDVLLRLKHTPRSLLYITGRIYFDLVLFTNFLAETGRRGTQKNLDGDAPVIFGGLRIEKTSVF